MLSWILLYYSQARGAVILPWLRGLGTGQDSEGGWTAQDPRNGQPSSPGEQEGNSYDL